jgi:L-fuculose-phosphate aldolase
MTDAALVAQFRRAGEDLARAGLVHAGAGNLSVWTPEGIIITREAASLDRITEADLCLIGRTTMPPRATPALDTPIHRAAYTTTGAKAILHAHPPHTIALSFDRHEFLPDDLEGAHLLGRVKVVSPRRNVVGVVAEALEESLITIVAGHGTYARGADFDECLRLTATLEASARIAWLRSTPPPAPPRRGEGS